MSEYRPIHHEFRDYSNDKILGNQIISPSRWQTEKERLKLTLERNREFSHEIIDDKNKGLKLRQRQADKEIQPMMKFTSNTTMDRIADALMEAVMLKSEQSGQDLSGLKEKVKARRMEGSQRVKFMEQEIVPKRPIVARDDD